MVTKNMTIEIKSGLEARPVAVFVQIASQFESAIYVEHDSKKVNAKSIMGMMSLSVCGGDEVVIVTEGADEELAANEIEAYLNKQ